MSKRKKGTKKQIEARKKLLEQPWWTFKDNLFFLGLFVVIVLIVVLVAVA